MRDYAGIHFALLPGSNHPDFGPRVRNMLGTIDYYLRDISRGMGRIENGEVPSGSGTSLSGVTDHGLLTGLADDDHTQYLLIAGRSGGQTAYGGTGSGDDLTLLSTSNATKGSIFLGTTSVYDETNSLLGIATLSPAARVHAVAKIGAGSTLAPSGDVSAGTAGPYTTGGTPIGGTHAAAVASNNDDISFVATNTVPGNGTAPDDYSLTGTITPGLPWIVTFRVAALSGTLAAGAQFDTSIVDSAGNRFAATGTSLVGLGTTWTTYTVSINGAGTPTGTGTANTLRISMGSGSNANQYVCLTYVVVDLDVAGTYAEAMVAQAVTGSSNQNVFSVRGATYSDLLFRVLDSGYAYGKWLDLRQGSTSNPALTIGYSGSPAAGDYQFKIVNGSGAAMAYYDAGAGDIFAATNMLALASFQVADAADPANSVAQISFTGSGSVRAITIPDVDGTIVLTNGTQTLQAKTLNVSSVLTASTASSGCNFADTTTSTKKLRMVLSGAVGNNSFTLSNTAARNYGFGNLSGNVVVVGDDPPAVAAGALGKVDLTGQTAAIGSTNLSSTPPAGFYEVQVVAICTTASGSGAPTLDVTLAWTDALGATTEKTINALSLSATGRAHGATRMAVASGNIAYSTTINAASGSPQYAVYIRVVALG